MTFRLLLVGVVGLLLVGCPIVDNTEDKCYVTEQADIARDCNKGD